MAKNYYDFMNEISSSELYEGLLAYGLFSEKLPPVFTSVLFFRYCQQTLNINNVPHDYIYYDNMRNINAPRPLGIPNPFAYMSLCKCLSDNWSSIQQHFYDQTNHQTHKASRIHIRKMYQKPHLFEMNYENWRDDGSPEPDLSLGKRYIVKADISSCFPSIYTHSLPWALVGKDYAKTHRNANDWFNKIDLYTRNIKYGETHGLIIGPHASNLLSEIVLTVIDKELNAWSYIRNIDDYTCYVKTYEEGQRFLTELGMRLREFDLSLNHKKTEILELPIASAEQWPRKLNSVKLKTDYGKMDYMLARGYLDYAIELMENNEHNSAILKYAIKVLYQQNLTYNAKEYCVRTILNFALIYPYLVSMMEEYVFQKYCEVCPSHSCIVRFSQLLYSEGIKVMNFEQVSHSLYFAVKYDFELPDYSADEAINSKNCIFLTMAYIYSKKRNDTLSIKKLKDHARTLLGVDDIDRYWLFVYEILPMSVLKDEWKPMKRAGVSFIDPFF